MADQAEITRHSHPLSRIVICCTSVPPDARQKLAKKAQDMGARHVLDLTSDVTHLVCEDITTPKYRYVAKMRTDVKVMMIGWVDSMYDAWIDGEDISPRDFEEKFRLPILYKLSVSVTGILDLADRKKIEDLVSSHGASYHPDLTRFVTHLIAAAPTGKKYEFAMNNNINVVTVEWLHESLERGMALEESCYDPRLPKEKLGAGAKPAPPTAVTVESLPEVSGKRKIRKRAGDLLGSQSQGIWGDILGQASNPKPKKRDEWEEISHADGAKNSSKDMPEAKSSEKLPTVPSNSGLMAQCSFYIHGFNKKQAGIVQSILLSYGANIVSSVQALKCLQGTSRLFVIVPVAMRKRNCPDFSSVKNVLVATDWWLEACMHKSTLVEPTDGFTYSPFEEFPLEGFKGMQICLTQFTGVELLHMRNLINLLGASFQDTLTKKRDLLITSLPAIGDKFEFAIQNDIPVVTAEWIRQCLKESKAVPFTDFLVSGKKRKSREPEDTEGRQWSVADGQSLENNKRPRLFGKDPRDGGKLLGENLQSFGDRLRGKKLVGANVADLGGKTSGPFPGNSGSMERIEKKHTPQESKGILDKCSIYISKNLKTRSTELSSVAKALGAFIIDSIHPDDSITHMIHSSKTPRDTTKDFKVAGVIPSCHIVSPDWLYKCQESGKKVDEKAYPPIIASSKGLEMDFTKGSSSSLSPVSTAELHIQMKQAFEVVDEAEDGQDFRDDFESLNEINHNITKEPTPPTLPSTSFPVPQISTLNLVTRPSSSDNQEAPDPASGKSSGGISDILGKLGKGEITNAIERKRPRGRLRGRATSNLSSYNDPSRASSVESHAEPVVSEARKAQVILHPPSGAGLSPDPAVPAPSQAIRYEDPEAEKERKNVRAKLSGDVVRPDTPKNQRSATKKVKTAVDVEGGLRRGRRIK